MEQEEPHTDQVVQADVSDELLYTPSVDAHLDVTADDGVVTIAGEVGSLPERLAAQRAAARVWGVTSVVDGMTVRPIADSHQDDADIAQTARQMLAWSVTVPTGAITVRVHDRILTLAGEVTWAYQRDAANRAVSDIRGISAIRNDIAITEKESVTVMQTAVEAAVRRNAPLAAQAINVDIDAHVVTLSGTVRSAAERRQVEHVAWAAAGVATVNNDLRISP